ncbi:L-2-hydroxyglutarate dehydrogenase, mitochondrial-like [Lingula anatina]|uniref:L-2-hydroxyglutarate dehydrogenase, mitochondrial n=1 Tax=Lingula anatina TaxID=7574 RepID=A0A1S3J4V7_LINAN|nr:L-2-hydroxyglutarate dehydrogenase, mitochondrial-like [Lingula anatina]|eukprot:XP_013404874.2 L-2-hydroxyglutarate dehydrogenase, mitochondrial-like [Lingula anatina]
MAVPVTIQVGGVKRFAEAFGKEAMTRCSFAFTRTHIHNRTYSSTSTIPSYDIVIVGGGVVGLGTARQLALNHPQLKLAVVEKENILAAHQSGKNSGVIHAGIYYTPGSLKAKLCVDGLNLTYKYCDENNIPYKKCGKLIVATTPEEVSRLDNLYDRGQKNNVKDLKIVGPEEIREIEPNCRGLRALHSPHTGIVDWGLVTRSYGKTFENLGGQIYTNFEVKEFTATKEDGDGIQYPVTILGKEKSTPLQSKFVIVCGGLYSDRLAKMSGCNPEPKIVPFRGDYLLLKPEKRDLVRGNIYPVPNPLFPFLGVHFTPRIDGDVWLGPNAVLAFKREGYKLLDFNFKDFVDAASYRGLRKLAMKHLAYGIGEMYRGFNIRATVKQLQKFVPSITIKDVTRGPSGVRAQALDRDGQLVDDFVFDSGEGELASRMLHVRNAPSPAATSSLAIAKMVADKAKENFEL